MNLQIPDGFRGLRDDVPVTMYVRHLPHWRQVGATYNVTFRLADSLPQAKLQALKTMRTAWELKYPAPRSESAWAEYSQSVSSKVNEWLDQGAGACLLAQPDFAAEMKRAIMHFQHIQYHVACYVVMPNHCHLVIRPFTDFALETVLGAMKQVVARFINRQQGTTGTVVWQQESFDRIIRDDDELYHTIQYIGRNPHNAQLDPAQWHRWLDPTWEALNWRFYD